MVTPDEIGQVEVFASLSRATLERMSKVAADITLVPGEWAAPEGGERALFAVLEGHIEAVKLVDGIERVVGSRDPGEIFGEVPITLGTVFPVGFRATESTRVMRIEPQDYHAVVAVEPDLGTEVGKLAANRIGGPAGLQSIAAVATESRAFVFGHRLHPASAELRRFLDRNQISFRWLVPDAPEAEADWGGPLPGVDDRPAIRLVGGKTVIRPRLRRVAELLGLGTEADHAEYDTVIVGAGPAGLAAAVYGA
jgi:thioredoxin reductase (NADPH)